MHISIDTWKQCEAKNIPLYTLSKVRQNFLIMKTLLTGQLLSFCMKNYKLIAFTLCIIKKNKKTRTRVSQSRLNVHLYVDGICIKMI